MKITPPSKRQDKTTISQGSEDQFGKADGSGGGQTFDMLPRGGGDDDPNGPPKAGASASVD